MYHIVFLAEANSRHLSLVGLRFWLKIKIQINIIKNSLLFLSLEWKTAISSWRWFVKKKVLDICQCFYIFVCVLSVD